jgi:hypothetical protein
MNSQISTFCLLAYKMQLCKVTKILWKRYKIFAGEHEYEYSWSKNIGL